MKILLIEDDKEVSAYIVKNLQESKHLVTACYNGKDGLETANNNSFDVMIIDRMLPVVDGLTIIKRLRAAGNLTPSLILSTLGDVDDKVKGLRSGGDDYLIKPFAFSELLARIEVLNRRNTKDLDSSIKLYVDDLEMDLLNRKVMRAGKKIDLQSREFKLLEYLMKNKSQVVTRTMLLENVWEYFFDPQTNIIDVHISRLRNKVDKGFEKQLIKTIRGEGFVIE
jgi:two-component system OmpR family response regulator